MWKIFFAAFSIVISAQPSIASPSTPKRSSLGAILGAPTAIVGKTWLDERRAIEAGASWNFNDWFALYGDYLIHFHDAFRAQREPFFREVSPFVGAGALVLESKNPPRGGDAREPKETKTNFNLRVPLGLEWLPPTLPISVFIEIVPGIYIVPDVSPSLQGGLGARYWF